MASAGQDPDDPHRGVADHLADRRRRQQVPGGQARRPGRAAGGCQGGSGGMSSWAGCLLDGAGRARGAGAARGRARDLTSFQGVAGGGMSADAAALRLRAARLPGIHPGAG